MRRPQKHRIGVVVPLASLLGAQRHARRTGRPIRIHPRRRTQAADRRRPRPRQPRPDAVHPTAHRQCRPTPRHHRTRPPPLSPASASDQDTSRNLPTSPPAPCPPTAATLITTNHGPTARHPATNMDPLCRRHHRAKTFAWHAYPPRRRRRRLDHARRRTLPMRRRTTTDGTSRLTRNAPCGRLQAFCGNPRFSPPWLGSSQRVVITLPRVKKCRPSTPWAWVSPNNEFFQPPNE